jgi:hypothetical protein
MTSNGIVKDLVAFFKTARHLWGRCPSCGSPFRLTVERRVRQITFIEVKCGRSRLTPVQRSVREAVENNKVYSEVWEVGNPEIPITRQLAHTSRRALPPGE